MNIYIYKIIYIHTHICLILEMKIYVLELNLKFFNISYEVIYATLIIESYYIGRKISLRCYDNFRVWIKLSYTVSLFLVALLFYNLNFIYALCVCVIIRFKLIFFLF